MQASLDSRSRLTRKTAEKRKQAQKRILSTWSIWAQKMRIDRKKAEKVALCREKRTKQTILTRWSQQTLENPFSLANKLKSFQNLQTTKTVQEVGHRMQAFRDRVRAVAHTLVFGLESLERGIRTMGQRDAFRSLQAKVDHLDKIDFFGDFLECVIVQARRRLVFTCIRRQARGSGQPRRSLSDAASEGLETFSEAGLIREESREEAETESSGLAGESESRAEMTLLGHQPQDASVGNEHQGSGSMVSSSEDSAQAAEDAERLRMQMEQIVISMQNDRVARFREIKGRSLLRKM